MLRKGQANELAIVEAAELVVLKFVYDSLSISCNNMPVR